MDLGELADYIETFPKKIAEEKLKAVSGAVSLEENDKVIICYGYEFRFCLANGSPALHNPENGLRVNVGYPSAAPLGKLPTHNRVLELLKLSQHIRDEIGVNSKSLGRALNYLRKGRVENEVGIERHGLPFPRSLNVFHALRAHSNYDPSKLFEAFWTVSGKPLTFLAQHYRL